MVFSFFKKSPSKETLELENKAQVFLIEVREGAEKRYKEYKEMSKKKEKDVFLTKKDINENIKDFAETIAKIKKLEDNYVRLQEKFKHEEKTRLNIARDWFDYWNNWHESIQNMKYTEHMDSEQLEDSWDASDKLRIKMQEIEKRFEKLLEQ